MAQLRNYLSFKEFVEKYGLKNEATSNVKIKEILDRLGASGEINTVCGQSCGIYMRDMYLTNKIGFKNAVLNLYYQTFKLNK